MNYPSIAKKAVLNPLLPTVGLKFSAAGLILALSALNLAYAQDASMGDSAAPGEPGVEYKRGETPTGQEYGIIKKGEPQKSDAAEKKLERMDDKRELNQEAQPRAGSNVDRDKRESHEGSGPDPLGRY